MAINHAETSILIDGIDTRDMSARILELKKADLEFLLGICKDREVCEICEKREIQLDVVNMEINARQEKGQAVLY